MRNLWCRYLLASLLASAMTATLPAAPSKIVVAIRYLQQTGTSHAHLFLYREDGTLLRQLTRDDAGQDRNPVFAPDGETIVFTRELPGGVKQWWGVEPRGGNLRRLDAAPDWYAQTKASPSFEHIYNGPPIVREPRSAPTDARSITSPDGKTGVQLIPTADTLDFGAPDKWDVKLRTTDGGQPVKIGELSGYSAGFLSHVGDDPEQCLLHDGNLDVAFCFVHLNSTDGNTIYALDLHTKRLVQLSPNMANPFPLPGEAAFLSLTEERYVPFGDGARTANCLYTDRWDASLKRVRYARKNAASGCYGASMYRPGRTPTTVTILGADIE